jgi:protein arginine kinase activator
MKCQKCEKPATFHITDLIDGKPNELHLCEECAHKILAPSSDDAADVLPTMAGLLAQHLAVGETAEELARLDTVSCPGVGITLLACP